MNALALPPEGMPRYRGSVIKSMMLQDLAIQHYMLQMCRRLLLASVVLNI